MAALEAISLFFPSHKSPFSNKSHTPSSSSHLTLFISTPTPSIALKYPITPIIHVPRKSQLYCSAVEEISVVKETIKEEEVEALGGSQKARKKLFVTNLPWAYTVEDIKTLFGECGTVSDVEIIKSSDGKHRGYVFVTMGTGAEAEAAMEKFNNYDVSGRIIRIEYSKRLKRPPPPPPPRTLPQETRFQLYLSNLGWKVRASHLREFFSVCSNPVSVKVVFDKPSGKSCGYGFASFATKEEAEAAFSALNGKELFERPIILKLNIQDIEKTEDKVQDIKKSEDEVGSTSEEEPVVS